MEISRRERRSGTAFVNTTPHVERGVIVAVYSDSLACDVTTESKKNLLGLPLPNMVQFPGNLGGHIEIPEVGTHVVVQYGVGRAFILGYYQAATESAITPGANDGASIKYRATAPNKLQPGEWVQYGDRNQLFGIFRNGITTVKAAPWAQITCSEPNEQINIFGRKIQLFTAMGNVVFDNNSGKQSLVVRLGTDLAQETANENWRFWFDLDANGSRFSMTSVDGAAVYTHNIDFSGNEIYDSKGALVHQCSARTDNINGAWTVRSNTAQFQITDNVDISANNIACRGSELTCEIGGSLNLFANRDVQVRSGRTLTFSATGPIPTAPGMEAVTWNIMNGSFVVNAGLAPGMPDAALAGVKLNAHAPGSEIQLNALLGNVIVNTTMPNSVVLGGMFGMSHVVRWEMGLQEFLNALIDWLSTHVHNANAEFSPTAPPLISPAPLKSFFAAIPSVRVMVGA